MRSSADLVAFKYNFTEYARDRLMDAVLAGANEVEPALKQLHTHWKTNSLTEIEAMFSHIYPDY